MSSEDIYTEELRQKIERLRAEIKAERARVKVLRGALGYILDYWNRDQNETAMADALWHIIESADEVLDITAPKGGEGDAKSV